MTQTLMTLDTRVGQRGIFIPPERKDGLVHVRAVEDVKRDKQVEVVDGKSGNRTKKVGLQSRYDVLECVLAEISEVHERRYTSGELNQLLLNLLSLRLVFLLFVRYFFLFFGSYFVALV